MSTGWCSAKDCVVPAMGKAVVPTDLAIACPPGTYARIAPRSGLAVKHFIDTGAGVVDEDYRGAVGVVLFNHSQEDFKGAPPRVYRALGLSSMCSPSMRGGHRALQPQPGGLQGCASSRASAG